jgi:hypothetical protein
MRNISEWMEYVIARADRRAIRRASSFVSIFARRASASLPRE